MVKNCPSRSVSPRFKADLEPPKSAGLKCRKILRNCGGVDLGGNEGSCILIVHVVLVQGIQYRPLSYGPGEGGFGAFHLALVSPHMPSAGLRQTP